MDLSAILPEEEGDLVFEGEGESEHGVGSIAQIPQKNNQLSRLIQTDTDASSDSLEDDIDNSGDGIDAVQCPQPLCCSSPIRSSGFNSPMLEFSKLSSRDASGFEGNGNGGELSMVDPVILQNEIAELRFQNQKLVENIQELQAQNAAYDDNQNSLMEDLEKRIGQCKVHSERHKNVQRELEETKSNLQRYEDTNIIYSKRIQRLEKDAVVLAEEAEAMRNQMIVLSNENEKYQHLLKESEQEFQQFKTVANERINLLVISKEEIEEHSRFLKVGLEELDRVNEQLKGEKQELEKNLIVAQESFLETKLASLEVSAIRNGDIVTDDEDLISFRASSCTPHKSIHAEIAASLSGGSTCDLPQFRHDSLITLQTPDGSIPWDRESPEFSHRVLSVLSEILEELQQVRFATYLESSSKEEKELGGDTHSKDADGCVVEKAHSVKESETIEQLAAVDFTKGPETSAKEVDVVRRIHEELAEFRSQLKKSQELFHAFNTSQVFNITKSCPLLADETDATSSPPERPQLVTIATQTEAPVIASTSHTNTTACHPYARTEESPDDIEALSCFINKLSLDDNELDKLSLDDDSYRLTINLPTVLEESEQETETSPATLPRRMSSDKRKRKLMRMSPMDEPIKSGDDSEFYSPDSTLPNSKNTSTYNSLERPLQISGGSTNNGGGEEFHDFGSDTTYNSPISSPSYYYTPSQGSSEETIANHDGDRTPVNEHFLDDETASCPPDPTDSGTSPSNGLRKRHSPIRELKLPIDNRSNSFNVGETGESDKDWLTKFAYDVAARSTDKVASILHRSEWRILKEDLRKKVVSQYNKGVAQEEGTDNDMGDGDPPSGIMSDLDDEAEQYIFETTFPDVVENLFNSLDRCKLTERQDYTPTERDHREIRERFNELSNVFKTDHDTLRLRADQSCKELKSVETRIDDIVKSFKSSVDNLRNNLDKYDNQDIIDVLHKMEESSLELESNSKRLTKKAKEVGNIDLEKRVYKLINVMVLYVHILRNYEIPETEAVSVKNSRDSDEDRKEGTTLPGTNSNGSIPSNNNNNEEKEKKGSWPGAYLEGQRMERWIAAGSEFIRRELSWPWNWEQTWKGVKQGFSVLLMLTGLLIIVKSVFPIVSADSSYCKSQPMNPVASVLAKHSSVLHQEAPTL